MSIWPDFSRFHVHRIQELAHDGAHLGILESRAEPRLKRGVTSEVAQRRRNVDDLNEPLLPWRRVPSTVPEADFEAIM